MAAVDEVVALRRAVLVASLLDDVPVVAADSGVVLTVGGDGSVTVPWLRLVRALAGAPAESAAGRLRLRDWLQACAEVARLLHDADDDADDDAAALRAQVVPLALPAGHVLHPGSAWVRERVLGGVLDLGLGLRLPGPVGAAAPGRVLALAPGVLGCAGVATASWWPPLVARLDELGALAVARLKRDGTTVVTPTGGCDALTLLASPTLRRHLAGGDGVGLRSVGAPMRTRAWFDLARIDPAFVVAAAAATDAEHRGVDRPLLVTADEVAFVRPRGDAARLHLVLDDVSAAVSSAGTKHR